MTLDTAVWLLAMAEDARQRSELTIPEPTRDHYARRAADLERRAAVYATVALAQMMARLLDDKEVGG